MLCLLAIELVAEMRDFFLTLLVSAYTLYNHKIQIPQKPSYLGFSYLKNDNPADIEVILTKKRWNKQKAINEYNQFELKPQ